MWRTLRNLRAVPKEEEAPSHPGLMYSRWAPEAMFRTEADTKGAAEARDSWLKALCSVKVSKHYATAYARWRRGLEATGSQVFSVRAESRLLLGHGNPSPTEVGLTLHHTWGVPVIPGSSLKGLTASYVETVYGPVPEDDDGARLAFEGVQWEGSRPVKAPGEVYRRLFGAPEVGSGARRQLASEGGVIFHDALWVPAGDATMLARDVLTVHQRAYYSAAGEETPWPSDFDDPNPVSFLTVPPGACFLVALEAVPGAPGGAALVARARRYLLEALASWGVGGKTAAGYGRLVLAPDAPPAAVAHGSESPSALAKARREVRASPLIAELREWLAAQGLEQRPLFRRLEETWRERLLEQDAETRQDLARLLSEKFKLKKGDELQRMNDLLTALRGEPPRQ
ncbi:type III-B CRISPR module RAMP protein Cmr6 [Corallococcus sp. H22C18031201]|nr:type III-B CRISPR module RAMP protein Cmr6 [Corallococcus sp. H22C18031201]